MTLENVKAFVKDLFTLRTVWLDKGGGRWAVKRRIHPLLRYSLWVIAVIVSAGVYSSLNNPSNLQAAQVTPVSEVKVSRLPEPEIPAVFVSSEPYEPSGSSRPMIIQLTTQANRSSIIFPTDANPETDRIISRPENLRPVTPPAPSINSETLLPDPSDDGKYSIQISKSTFTLTLYRGKTPVKEYSIAVGKNPGDKQRKGDNRTPVGNFKIVSIENASKWSHDFRDGKGKIKGAYGPWFFRLDAKGWKGIGIHGTHDPDSRGTNATEGCIRLSNEDIAELRQYAYKNMPVTISEN